MEKRNTPVGYSVFLWIKLANFEVVVLHSKTMIAIRFYYSLKKPFGGQFCFIKTANVAETISF